MLKIYKFLLLLAVTLPSLLHAQLATIGAGANAGTTGSNAGPIYRSSAASGFDFSRQSYVYTAAELSAAGITPGTTITSVAWNKSNAFGTAAANTVSIWRVFMKNSAIGSYTAATSWATLNAGSTMVYENTAQTIPGPAGYVTLTLTTPFIYTGGDLEIGSDWDCSLFVGNPTDGGFAWSSDNITNRTLGNSNSVPITANLNLQTIRPQIQLGYIPAPPTPTQAPGIPDCVLGTTLDVIGAPLPGDAFYWQSSATGTSLANPYSGPYTIFANGTYYLRTHRAAVNAWSNASSVVVSNFPTAPLPPSPTALQNPACTPGTDISVTAAPIGETYYWQGTDANGTLTTQNASTPFSVTSTGTYYVRNQDASSCWSDPVGLLVTVNSVIPPDPTASIPNFNYCSTENPMNVTAQIPVLSGPQIFNQTTTLAGTDNANVTSTVNVTGITGPVSSAVLNASIGTNCIVGGGSWYYYSIIVNGTTVATQQCNQTNFDLTPYLPLTSVSIVSFDDPADGFGDAVTMVCNVVINFTGPLPSQPAFGINWYDTPTAGTLQGTGTTINGLGTPVLPVATAGVHTFYAGTDLGGCASTGRVPVTITVSAVNVPLTPINVTCNGFNDGSFSAGTPLCGTAPFEYSVDGGAFGPIPTNLTAGTYSVVIREAATPTNMSGANTVVITEPGAPTALTATGITFFNATLGWTASGSETTWTIEYGPVGFTPGTGTIQTATTNPWPISGLTEDTDYEFYVAAGCSPTSAVTGPFGFSTDIPFFTYDNQCGPGFFDISGTGTGLNLADDATTVINLTTPVSVDGVSATAITVSNNGFIQFGGVTLNAWNLDLDAEEGNVFWEETTIGGDPYLVVEWYQRPRFSGVIGQNVTFQILINQTTNEVYYIYDDVVFGGTQASNDFGGQGTISAVVPSGTQTISVSNTTYLTNNSCVHFYGALCPNVQNFSGIIFSDDALLDWNPGAYGETNWTVIYGPAGFDPLTAGTTTTWTSSDANFGGLLTQLTTYDVYIYSECAADSITSTGYFYQFTTKPNCADPTAFIGSTLVDSLSLDWNWIANPGFDIQQFNIQYSMEDLNDFTEIIANGTNNADTVVDATLIPSGVYEVYVQAACLTGDTSNWVGPISLVMPLENDTTCGAPLLNVDETQYIFNNTGATTSLGENAIAPNATGAQTTDGWINSTINSSLWYKFVAPSTGSIRINSTVRSYDGQIAVYEMTNCDDFNTFSLIAANDDEIGGTSKAPNFTVCGLTPGSEYYILFDGFNGTQGEFAIMLKEINLNAGTANPTAEICTGEDIVLFTTIAGFDNGGSWSSAIPSVNASITDSLFSSTGLAYQTFDFEYRVVDGCAYDTIISQVEIFAPSNAGLDGTITTCRNQPINLFGGLNGTADLTGQWYDPSNNPTSDNITTLNFAGNYNYDYIVGNGICPDDTANVVVTVTSCNHLSIDEEIFEGVTIHPNPTAGILFIESGIQFNMTITDANGRFVSTNTTSVAIGTTSVDLSTVERGVYFVNLTNGTSSKVYRVIVQ